MACDLCRPIRPESAGGPRRQTTIYRTVPNREGPMACDLCLLFRQESSAATGRKLQFAALFSEQKVRPW